MARICIVEDHEDTRRMLAEFVSHCAGLQVCGMAQSGEEALAQLDGANADLILIDVSLPGMSGIDLLRTTRERWPQLRCLVVSAFQEAMYGKRVLALGAQGYVTKGDPEQLFDAIPLALAGKTYPPKRAPALTPRAARVKRTA